MLCLAPSIRTPRRASTTSLTFDPAKRAVTLQDRSLDFADAPLVFAGVILEIEDDRRDYTRIRTIGYLAGRA